MNPYGPRKYSIFLFYSSFWMLLATFISLTVDDIYITCYFLLLFLTSINHWRRPEYGMRRNIDLCVVYIGLFILLLQMCLLKSEFNRYCVFSILVCCVVIYFIEHVLAYFNNKKWVILHMTLHIYVSCSPILLMFD